MDVTATQPTQSPSIPAAQASSTTTSDYEMFLQMLTAQMKYQDPLNPVESTDYATQLATFSSVEQAVLTNDLLKSLTEQLTAGGLSEMAGLVGKEVRTSGAISFDGAPIALDIAPAPLADKVEVIVRDANGVEVQRLDVAVGTESISWAGVGDDGTPLPNGAYRFELVSSLNGDVIAQTAITNYAKVTEVRVENGQTVLVLEGGIVVPATEVTALRDGV